MDNISNDKTSIVEHLSSGAVVRILVVKQEGEGASSLVEDIHASSHGYHVEEVNFEQDLFIRITKFQPEVILFDLQDTLSASSFDQVEELVQGERDVPIILVGKVLDVVPIIRYRELGVFEYLSRPFRRRDLVFVLEKACAENEKGKIYFKGQQIDQNFFNEYFGTSKQIKVVLEQVKLVSMVDLSVLITGKSGTGKEGVANLIHELSPRRSKSFVSIDCGAIPENLLESELFGFDRGAFTGAVVSKPGLIELANGGTLFLDEVGNLSLGNQVKLLRVLEERQVQRIGSNIKRDINIRLIVATNADLTENESQSFRRDLFYRLNEYQIKLPSLRDRIEDIPVLAKLYLKESEAKLNKKNLELTEGAMETLVNYAWPGNVRELKNVLLSAALMASQYISSKHLNLSGEKDAPPVAVLYGEELKLNKSFSLKSAMQEVEAKIIQSVLAYTKGNKSQAAKILKVSRRTLYNRIDLSP